MKKRIMLAILLTILCLFVLSFIWLGGNTGELFYNLSTLLMWDVNSLVFSSLILFSISVAMHIIAIGWAVNHHHRYFFPRLGILYAIVALVAGNIILHVMFNTDVPIWSCITYVALTSCGFLAIFSRRFIQILKHDYRGAMKDVSKKTRIAARVITIALAAFVLFSLAWGTGYLHSSCAKCGRELTTNFIAGIPLHRISRTQTSEWLSDFRTGLCKHYWVAYSGGSSHGISWDGHSVWSVFFRQIRELQPSIGESATQELLARCDTILEMTNHKEKSAKIKELKNELTTMVSFGYTSLTNAELANVKDMERLQSHFLDYCYTKDSDGVTVNIADMAGVQVLDLSETGTETKTLVALKELKSLRKLNLAYLSLSDADLAHLKDIEGLQALSLEHTTVTGEGLANLKDLKNLTSLNLANSEVTDDGLANLKELKNLQSLNLSFVDIRAAGLANLKNMNELKRLDLNWIHMGDEGLVFLKELKNLQSLSLTHTSIKNDDLAQLAEMKNLKYLDLWGTKVTKTGVKRLQKALPNTRIYYDD